MPHSHNKALVVLITTLSVISLVSAFQIAQQAPLTAQRGNITDQQYQVMLKTISNAQESYDELQFNRIAQNVSLTLKVALPDFRWSVFAFRKGIKDLAMSTINMERSKYISIIQVGKYGMSFQIYGTNAGYGCPETGGGGSAVFGQNITSTNQDLIKSAVDSSIEYRGDNIEGAAMYIANKTGAVFGFSSTFVVIANPTTLFGFYICRYQEYWASLREYGDFKWNYYMLRH